MGESAPDDGRVLLRQRPIPDRCDYLAAQLAPHIEPKTMPREALIAVSAAIVNLGAIGAEVRTLLADLAAATARAEQAEARVSALTELVADVGRDNDQLRARLAEIGETRVEWAVLHRSGRDEPLSEADARRFAAQAAWAGARLQNRLAGAWRDVDAYDGCLCPHSRQPDGTLTRDGVLAVGCPVHDPDAGGGGGDG